MRVPRPHLLRFGPFELDVRAGEIRKHGVRIRLQDQSFQILLMLLENPGEVVMRDEIRLRLWPNNTIVEFDHSINAAIKRLRQALGESADAPRYIETLAKRGYRFLGEVEDLCQPSPESEPEGQPAFPNPGDGELIGTVASNYRILDKLGEGGMGVVYRAEDLKLGRLVALKVLPSPAAETPGIILQRFEREARAASALNHPHICTVYGLVDFNGQPAIVMELVEGGTLTDRLSKGRLPLQEALRIAIQIADAMAEAHRKGIVHRDLKPSNVVFARHAPASPGVKVLDFGLAKMECNAVGDGAATMVGAVLGTPHYMSPEQAQGKEADARSDIFSFGVLLYEMLVGKRPFEGQSAASVMSAILEREPPPLGDTVSAPLARAVHRCLAKDPEDRWQSARDLRAELEWIAAEWPGPPPAMRAPRRIQALTIGAGVVAASIVFLAVLLREKPAVAPVIRFQVFPPANNIFGGLPGPAVSPDGRRIIFGTISKEDYNYNWWVRSLDSPNLVPLAGAEEATWSPFWSPDGKSVAFFDGRKLKKVDMSGPSGRGQAVTLGDFPSLEGGAWSRDGVILFPTVGGPLYRVSDSGGSPAPATNLDEERHESAHTHPWFLPDGRHFLFQARGFPSPVYNQTIRIGSLDSRDSKILLSADSNAIFAQGNLLYLQEDTLMARPFDPRRLVLTGEAVPIAEHVAPFGDKGPFSASENGPLVYLGSGDAPPFELVWFDRNGNRSSTLGGAYAEASPNYSPQFSPDGKTVALAWRERNNTDIWLYDVARGSRTRFTFDAASELAPIWSPDGRMIAFASNRSGHSDLYRKAADVSGAEELLYADDDQKYPTSWSPDGRFVAFDRFSSKKPQTSVWILPLTAEPPGSRPKPFPIAQSMVGEERGQFSPDGRWIAYESRESGEREIYVAPFQPAGGPPWGKQQISTAGGSRPRWSRDGKEIFYIAGRRLVAVAVETGERAIKVGEQRQIIGPLSILGYDVTSDGRRFLLRLRSLLAASQPLTVVENWTAALKRSPQN